MILFKYIESFCLIIEMGFLVGITGDGGAY